jgi:transcription elongation factor GreA-like protein
LFFVLGYKQGHRVTDALTISKETAATLDQTVRSERKRLLDFIRKRVRNQSDAEDILQDVFSSIGIESAGPILFRLPTTIRLHR